MRSNQPSENSQPDSNSSSKPEPVVYRDPYSLMHDLVNGKIPPAAIPMDKWIQGNIIAMVEKKQPSLELEVPYGGGLYLFHHYIKTINPPVSDVATVLEDIQ